MDALGIGVGAVAIGLALFAVLFAWQIHKETHRVLADILKSSTVTETHTSQTFPQLLRIIEEQVKNTVDSQVRSKTEIISDEEQKKLLLDLRSGILNEVSKVLAPMVGLQSTIAEKKVVKGRKVGMPVPSHLAEYEWYWLLNTINQQENSNRFVGIQRFIEEALKHNTRHLEAFQYAIDQGALSTYQVANPKNLDFPATAIRLVRTHPLVVETLG